MVAVVRNPWAEPGLALKLLPALPLGELADLAADGALHPLLRATAARLRARRAAPPTDASRLPLSPEGRGE